MGNFLTWLRMIVFPIFSRESAAARKSSLHHQTTYNNNNNAQASALNETMLDLSNTTISDFSFHKIH